MSTTAVETTTVKRSSYSRKGLDFDSHPADIVTGGVRLLSLMYSIDILTSLEESQQRYQCTRLAKRNSSPFLQTISHQIMLVPLP